MLLFVSPRLAGPLAVAIAALRKWYVPPDPTVRDDLARLQSMLQKTANGGHSQAPFDVEDLLSQAVRMKPLVVTYDVAGEMLGCGVHTVQRRVRSGKLSTIGEGPGTRVVVASIEEFVARESRLVGVAS